VFSPGEIVAVFPQTNPPAQLATSASSASSAPLPLTISGVSATLNGEAVPLWFVSPGQLNVQIPYEAPVGTSATLEINNNGQIASWTLPIISAASPGIFVNPGSGNIVNGLPAPSPGTETALYVTGIGAVTPAIATGAAPAASTPLSGLPAPVQNVSVTVNGKPATVQFAGIIWGNIGVAQINFTVPLGTPAGAAQVVVTVGSASSAPAPLIVGN
jgi:uncharacterized protein (TIGR03437 family)